MCCCSYSLLLVTVLPLVILVHTSARLSHTRNKLTIDDRRESDERMERTKDTIHGITTHKNSPFPATAAARHQRQSRRRLSDTTDRTSDIDTYSDSSSSSFDWRIANASVSLSAFAYCANDTIVSFKVHHHHIPFSILSYPILYSTTNYFFHQFLTIVVLLCFIIMFYAFL